MGILATDNNIWLMIGSPTRHFCDACLPSGSRPGAGGVGVGPNP